MSKQVSPTLIGSFFLAALGLVIIAILMFGGGSFFKKHHQFVLFFHTENNLNGLNVGAPVKLEGVKIGEVKEVALLLDDLILNLRDNLNATIVMVTHELASIFAIGSNSVFLDPETKTMIAEGDPKKLLKTSKDERVIKFLSRINKL